MSARDRICNCPPEVECDCSDLPVEPVDLSWLDHEHDERVAQMAQHARDVFAADMDDAPDGGERQ